ncbi:hypothetical protein HA402_014841 [Bradysia odoriphaga]|nr:hypothetical protein HA402_014841 [Bradysia odoriphaga]
MVPKRDIISQHCIALFMVPFDPYRLVFPPVPATILATCFYQPIPLLASCPKIVLAGGLIGYLCYDMIHYYIHSGSPTFNYMYMLKRYHYQHHFVHHDAGFGISSPIWDAVFETYYATQLRF